MSGSPWPSMTHTVLRPVRVTLMMALVMLSSVGCVTVVDSLPYSRRTVLYAVISYFSASSGWRSGSIISNFTFGDAYA